MPCLFSLLAMCFPRFVLVVLFFFSPYLQHAFHTGIWPLLGFLFMPMTTLAYLWAHHARGGSVEGAPLLGIAIAAVLDLGLLSGSKRSFGRRSRK